MFYYHLIFCLWHCSSGCRRFPKWQTYDCCLHWSTASSRLNARRAKQIWTFPVLCWPATKKEFQLSLWLTRYKYNERNRLTASYKELHTTFNKKCTFVYCYFSTAILLKVVVANENEINNLFLWSFKTEMLTKWTLRSFKKRTIVDSVQRRIAKNICSQFHVKQI